MARTLDRSLWQCVSKPSYEETDPIVQQPKGLEIEFHLLRETLR